MELLIGGPGTGKTTTLINKIKEIKPERFALLSFTRQAANEAKQRLKSHYSAKELDWVRTIHSLAFKVLGLNKHQVFNFEHLKDFGREYGFEFTGKYRNEEDGTFEGLTEDDITYRKMQIVANQQLNNIDNFGFDMDAIEHMNKKYREYKISKQLYDFNNMLSAACRENLPQFDLLCIDETQDLSPLQFALIDQLMKSSTRTIFAGDDDQMIYEWAGVKREYFMNLWKNKDTLTEILTENYRLPGDVLAKSRRIIEKIPDHRRINKPCSTHIHDCHFKRISDISEIKFDPTLSYLILVRNSYLLNNIKFLLDELGLRWEYLNYKDQYSGEKNIHLSTIHGSKGAEADVVILLPDCSPATYENITKDSEHRVFYVAVTRTKKQLIIVDPQSPFYYDL